uniref:Fibronectin type-III domain-containing protein n=1 Tax=Ascaris lumbricoides TaxID=6252 RepID=A0A0M3HK84_ASCLU
MCNSEEISFAEYIIRFWEDSHPANKKTLEVTSDTQSVTISELKASTRYTVDVQAWTKVGAGLRTEGRFESGLQARRKEMRIGISRQQLHEGTKRIAVEAESARREA